jgi:sugar/nucleoside kinase (ribokinase family)
VAAVHLLTAGEAFDDLVFVGLDRLPGPGEEVRTDTFRATIGGGAVITAVGAARLGVSTAIISGLSDAAAARLRRERVTVTNLRRPREAHAITAAISTTTERSFVTFRGVNAVLEPRVLRALATARARHVHLALGPHDLPRWTRLVTRLRRRGTTVSWDFGWNEALAAADGLAALMDAADLVFLNELEAPLYAHATSLDDAYPRLRTTRSNVVVKLGSMGSRWLRADGDVVMPAPVVDAVDTTGAGDAFNAGFLAAWLRGAAPAACLATGNSVGAASTRAAGGIDALPTLRQVPRALRPPAHARTSRATTVTPRRSSASASASGARATTSPSARPPTSRARATATSASRGAAPAATTGVRARRSATPRRSS